MKTLPMEEKFYKAGGATSRLLIWFHFCNKHSADLYSNNFLEFNMAKHCWVRSRCLQQKKRAEIYEGESGGGIHVSSVDWAQSYV